MSDQRAHPARTRSKAAHTPVRMCAGCRGRAPVGELLRMVAVDGRLVVDERRRLPGRGVWLHHDPGCLATAERRRVLPRALRVSGGLDLTRVRQYFEQGVQSTNRRGGSAAEPERRKQVDPS